MRYAFNDSWTCRHLDGSDTAKPVTLPHDAMLDACDRLGMLVMDEYVDMWYIHKTQYDYAFCME